MKFVLLDYIYETKKLSVSIVTYIEILIIVSVLFIRYNKIKFLNKQTTANKKILDQIIHVFILINTALCVVPIYAFIWSHYQQKLYYFFIRNSPYASIISTVITESVTIIKYLYLLSKYIQSGVFKTIGFDKKLIGSSPREMLTSFILTCNRKQTIAKNKLKKSGLGVNLKEICARIWILHKQIFYKPFTNLVAQTSPMFLANNLLLVYLLRKPLKTSLGKIDILKKHKLTKSDFILLMLNITYLGWSIYSFTDQVIQLIEMHNNAKDLIYNEFYFSSIYRNSGKKLLQSGLILLSFCNILALLRT